MIDPMIDPSHPAPIWVIWPYLSWLERLSFLALCILGIYWLFSVATVLRFRSTAGKLPHASVQEKLVSIRKRLKNLQQATVAAFYFFGFVLFAGLLSAYFVSANTKISIDWMVLQDFQAHFAFAGNAFFLFLVLHLIHWFVESRVNAFARGAPVAGAERAELT
jgi:hypothetical protein